MTLLAAQIAANRFGLGARHDQAMPADPRGALLGELERYDPAPPALAALDDPRAAMQVDYDRLKMLRRSGADQSAIAMVRQQVNGTASALYRDAVTARLHNAVQTETPFIERLVFFWSNHFSVSADSSRLSAYAGRYERDAIRPLVLGRFADLLLAAVRHPAMLIYLNQDQSIGPNSPLALADAEHVPPRHRGLNENLGREIMELHTLGVRSGYSQADVTEFARALTGWTVSPAGQGATFDPRRHEPGARTVLGRLYPQDGGEQATAILLDFARAPATATHLAGKLARHFAGDDPPPALVARLADSFRRSDGDLSSLYRVLIASPECWVRPPVKFKTPWDWTVSALRGLGTVAPDPDHAALLETRLGQPTWKPGSPAGWDDSEATWAAPNALMQRVRVAAMLGVSHAAELDARSLAPQLLPATLSAATESQIARAESPSNALALLFASPDFLRR